MNTRFTRLVEQRINVGEVYLTHLPTALTSATGEIFVERKPFEFICLYCGITWREDQLDPLVEIIALSQAGQVVKMIVSTGYALELKNPDGTYVL